MVVDVMFFFGFTPDVAWSMSLSETARYLDDALRIRSGMGERGARK